MNRIREADVIIYAGSLVNPELLSYAKVDCKIYNSAHMTLDEVVAVMREAEAAGKGTVRTRTASVSPLSAAEAVLRIHDRHRQIPDYFARAEASETCHGIHLPLPS